MSSSSSEIWAGRASRWALGGALLVLMLSLPLDHAWASQERPTWHVELVIDQSGSMVDDYSSEGPQHAGTPRDPAWNSVLAPAILADLSEQADKLVVNPQCPTRKYGKPTQTMRETCEGLRPDLELKTGSRHSFKSALEKLHESGYNSEWAPALSRAVKAFEDPGQEYDNRVVLMVYDGGIDAESGVISGFRDRAKRAGVDIVVFGMGGDTRDTTVMKELPSSPELGRVITDSAGLLQAFAEVFRRLVGAKAEARPQKHPKAEIELEIPSSVRTAWVVVVADDLVKGLEERPGNPTGEGGEPPGTGHNFERHIRKVTAEGRFTQGDPVRRGYRLYRIQDPEPGTWRFSAETEAPYVDTLLLLHFNLDARVPRQLRAVQGVPKKIEILLEGHVAPGTKVRFLAEGRDHELECDGKHHCEAMVTFSKVGDHVATVRVDNDHVEISKKVNVKVGRPVGFRCSPEHHTHPGRPLSIAVPLRQGAAAPEKAWVEVDGRTCSQLTRTGSSGQYAASCDLAELSEGTYTMKVHHEGQDEVATCESTVYVHPWVEAELQSTSEVTLGPCDRSAEPSAGSAFAACREAGECCGESVDLTIETTSLLGVKELSARVFLDLDDSERLPRGVTVYPAGGSEPMEYGPDSGVPVTLMLGSQTVSFRVCSNHCPGETANGAALRFALKIDERVYHKDRAGSLPPEAYALKTSTVLHVRQSSPWTCNRDAVFLVLAILVALFIVMGFIRPLRFPSVGERTHRHGFPHSYGSRSRLDIGELNRGMVSIRQTMPAWRWYTNDVVHLTGGTLDLSLRGDGSLASIILERPGKGPPRVRIVPASGQTLLRASWTEGQGFKAYKVGRDWEQVDSAGEPLQRGYVYFVNGQDRVALFR